MSRKETNILSLILGKRDEDIRRIDWGSFCGETGGKELSSRVLLKRRS